MCWLVSVSFSDWLAAIANSSGSCARARVSSPTEKPFIASCLFDGGIVMLFEKVRNNGDIIWCNREDCTSCYAFQAVICSQFLVVTL